MKKISLLITLCLITGSLVFAQSLYEMDFHFAVDKNSPKEEYKAFFLLNGDGTGEMRVAYEGETPQDRIVLECEIKQGFAKDKNNNIDYNKMYYTGKDIFVVIGDTSVGDFPPISFWFKLNKETDIYEPWAVMTKDEEGKTLQGVIDDIRLLEEGDLTKQFVLRYFTKEDEIYKNLFETNIRTLTTAQKSSRMFLLTVADTEDENIGADCDTDRKKQQAYFKKIADKLQIPIIISELFGKDLSKSNLLSKLDELQPAKNDIVIFHYSGHGYSKEDNRQYPYLDLRYDKDIPVRAADEINMEEVYTIIKNKPGRLNLVISDCCNWHLDVSNVKSTNIANPRPSSVGLSVENMQALFMSPDRTSLMITAAAKGQVSAGNPTNGGIFTSQFREALQKYMGINYQNITWQQITENTQQQTATVAGYSLCPRPENPNEYNKCSQTPVFKMN